MLLLTLYQAGEFFIENVLRGKGPKGGTAVSEVSQEQVAASL